ncbi:Histone deacetylase domain containing protein [Naviculisporaceae sp. PSN 640]
MSSSSFTPRKSQSSSPTTETKEKGSKGIPSIDSRKSSNDSAVDNDISLLNALNHLSISSPSPRSPRPRLSTSSLNSHKPPPLPARSPSTPRPASSLRSPLNGAFAANTPSRASTPSLLRKASMNSLHSVNGGTSRRPSAGNMLSPTTVERQASPEPPKWPTPESVATGHFTSELETYHGGAPLTNLPASTVVILNDSCYGHRYARPLGARKPLPAVPERPERLKASVLGVSAAYVRLGGRHKDGSVPIRQSNGASAISSVPFRIHKTTRRISLMSPTVTNVHDTKWMTEFITMCNTAAEKLSQPPPSEKEKNRTEIDRDDPEKAVLHHDDLYLCPESLSAIEGALGGVFEAVDTVFQPQGPKRAFVAIRPPGHHCSDVDPRGFCWVNNVHVGIMHGSVNHGLTHAAIIDFDLHHGDGSQELAWKHNAKQQKAKKKKASIGYFSLHDIESYPCEDGDMNKVMKASVCMEAHGQSIWNVHLQKWATEDEFWRLYESQYIVLLDKVHKYLCTETKRLQKDGVKPKGAIFLSAGFDASEWEAAGMQRHGVNVPTGFYARFTSDVVRMAAQAETGVEGRIISVLEGGYSDRALCSGIMSHICGLAGKAPAAKQADMNGVGEVVTEEATPAFDPMEIVEYEPSWWAESQLELLEKVPEPIPEPKPVRNITPPTYSSPTQASVARSVNPQAVRLAASGASAGSRPSTSAGMIPPSPPEVSWTVATQALSKLLIPTGRQTASLTTAELRAAAQEIRQARRPPSPEERQPSRQGLRSRKPKPAVSPETVAGTQAAATPGRLTRRQAGRRLSAASTVVSDGSDPTPSMSAEPPSGGPRAETALSIRPESSMSSHVPRTARTPRASSKRLPSVLPNTAPTKTTRRAPSSAATTPTTSESPSPLKSQPPKEVNGPTNDVKKPKVKIVTPAMREARERERLAKEGASSMSVSPALEEEPHQPPSTSPPEQYQQPALVVKQEVDLTSVSPLSSYPPAGVSPQQAMVSPPDLFVQYQPEGLDLESDSPIPTGQNQGPLRWLPPDTPTRGVPSTPSPGTGMRREDLPMFTATSAIPFAVTSSNANGNGNGNAVSSMVKELEEHLNGPGLEGGEK